MTYVRFTTGRWFAATSRAVRSALQSAASSASLLLTTDAVVCESTGDKEERHAGGMPQGHGGVC